MRNFGQKLLVAAAVVAVATVIGGPIGAAVAVAAIGGYMAYQNFKQGKASNTQQPSQHSPTPSPRSYDDEEEKKHGMTKQRAHNTSYPESSPPLSPDTTPSVLLIKNDEINR